MIHQAIRIILISLFIFTPIAFGSMDIWAFSLMELGILLIISLYAIQKIFFNIPSGHTSEGKDVSAGAKRSAKTAGKINSESLFPLFLLFLFLALILFQMIPLQSGVIKYLSPKAYQLRQLLFSNMPFTATASGIVHNLPPDHYALSLFPFATQIEFFKWFSLIGFFLFLFYGRLLDKGSRMRNQLIVVIILTGMGESLYGMIEFFSGHHHILYLDEASLMPGVTGTFINRNYFAGYLLMVIPLSMGYLFSREDVQRGRSKGWRYQLSFLDGKTFMIGFGIIVMILGLLFSASRMGIVSLFLSFTLISLLFRNPHNGKRLSKTSISIFALALLWAVWMGLDAVISRFFTATEDFKIRWDIWVDTFRIFKDFPVFGSGLGTFAQVFPIYRSFHLRGIVTHAENDFLQMISEVGTIGAGLMTLVFFILIYRAVSWISLISPADPQRFVGIGCLVAIFTLIFHSIVERNIQVPANALLFTFIVALVVEVAGVKKIQAELDSHERQNHNKREY